MSNNRKAKRLSVTISLSREDLVESIHELLASAEDWDLVQEFLNYCLSREYLKEKHLVRAGPVYMDGRALASGSSPFHKWDDKTLAKAYMELHKTVYASNSRYYRLSGASHSEELLF